jgi:hypothetical protein
MRVLAETQNEVEVEVNLRPPVSRPVRLGIGPPYGTLDQILSFRQSASSSGYRASLWDP